jgi:hypothetical protein
VELEDDAETGKARPRTEAATDAVDELVELIRGVGVVVTETIDVAAALMARAEELASKAADALCIEL